eukprot:1757434-Rhodomonas_salina.4
MCGTEAAYGAMRRAELRQRILLRYHVVCATELRIRMALCDTRARAQPGAPTPPWYQRCRLPVLSYAPPMSCPVLSYAPPMSCPVLSYAPLCPVQYCPTHPLRPVQYCPTHPLCPVRYCPTQKRYCPTLTSCASTELATLQNQLQALEFLPQTVLKRRLIAFDFACIRNANGCDGHPVQERPLADYLVLTHHLLVCGYAISGHATDLAYSAVCLGLCYAMPDTELGYGDTLYYATSGTYIGYSAILCYAMSGTDTGYCATRHTSS